MDESLNNTLLIEERLKLIEQSLEEVSARNHRVELEKAWETSPTRIIAIVLVTYFLMCLVFYLIGIANWGSNAVIPTLGYFLSTQSLPILKSWWIRKL